MSHISASLLSNAALIVLFAVLWSRAEQWLERHALPFKPYGLGLLAGFTSIAAMLFPLQVAPGVFIDMRTLVLALSAMVGGPLAGLTAGFCAALFRLWVGGAGTGAGLFSITLAAALGSFVGLRHEQALFRNSCLGILAIGAALAPLCGVFLLPNDLWPMALEKMIWLAPAQCLATLMVGLLIRSEARRRAEIDLAFFYKVVAETLPEALNAKDRQGRFIVANPATARAMRVAHPDQVIGKTDADFHPPEIAARYRADEEQVYEKGEALHIEQPFQSSDGRKGWFSTLKNPIRDPKSGEIVGLVTHNRDITEQKELERQLQESRQQLSDALSNMADGLAMFDREGRLVFCNGRYQGLFSKTADLRHPGALLSDIIAASKAAGEEITAEGEPGLEEAYLPLPRPGTRELRLWDGRVLEAKTRSVGGGGVITVFSDVTRMRQAEELLRDVNRTLEKAAFTDALTGLFNRRAFDDRLTVEFARARRAREPLSLLMVDIDHFKQFNDHYGHQRGDDCLRAVAGALGVAARRGTDIAARYGGEEMALVLPGTDAAGANEVAERYCRAVRALGLDHAASPRGMVTVSVGVAVILPEAGDRPDDLIAAADSALYRAKHAGRDCVRCADTERKGRVPRGRRA
ncbi:diguanylate cyclase [Rhizobium paknamense]|uniref:diguanylate cyclase n=1 Tax=Rhizobium paknamense TaxID=1206817 RepID=A0ABU0II74_9HYPH|nr:diguanylate cyclase [Rhizobium paknamense]MDQ0456921.1 diguanylate cyclase (GGDEF)-like protein/PAS domain S-box-containing protein [Rhizobium paknamense]